MEQEILGLPVASKLPHGVSPYAAMAIVKCMDDEGYETYAVLVTDGITSVEGAGLVRFADKYVDKMLDSVFDAED